MKEVEVDQGRKMAIRCEVEELRRDGVERRVDVYVDYFQQMMAVLLPIP